MLDTSVVVIPLERYNELLQKETRVNVLAERLWHNDFLSREDILWILDTELSVSVAEELRKQSEMEVAKALCQQIQASEFQTTNTANVKVSAVRI